jgi:hypothetical protein
LSAEALKEDVLEVASDKVGLADEKADLSYRQEEIDEVLALGTHGESAEVSILCSLAASS